MQTFTTTTEKNKIERIINISYLFFGFCLFSFNALQIINNLTF